MDQGKAIISGCPRRRVLLSIPLSLFFCPTLAVSVLGFCFYMHHRLLFAKNFLKFFSCCRRRWRRCRRRLVSYLEVEIKIIYDRFVSRPELDADSDSRRKSESKWENERAKQKQRRDQHGVSSGLATFNTTVVHLSLSLVCPRHAPLPPSGHTCYCCCCCSQLCCISRSSNKQRQLLHLPRRSLPLLLPLFFFCSSPCFSSWLPGQVSSGLWSGSLCSLACRSVRLIGYEQLSDWFYWVAFVMCSGCLSLSLCLCRCLCLSYVLCCCCRLSLSRLRLPLRCAVGLRFCGCFDAVRPFGLSVSSTGSVAGAIYIGISALWGDCAFYKRVHCEI